MESRDADLRLFTLKVIGHCPPESTMTFLSTVMDTIENLPDPLVYSIIAIFTTGSVYSSFQHAKNWRPRKAKRLKLKGADGKKIEDCRRTRSLATTLICSVDFMEPRNSCAEYKL